MQFNYNSQTTWTLDMIRRMLIGFYRKLHDADSRCSAPLSSDST